MRPATSRRLVVAVALSITFLLLFTNPPAHAGFIVPDSASALSAASSAQLTGVDASDSRSDTDSGDLVDPFAAAAANASLASGETTTTASGASSANLAIAGETVTLSGATSAAISDNHPFAAIVISAARIDMPFSIGADSSAAFAYELTINAMVQNNEKVAILLTRDGAADPILAEVFKASTSAALPDRLDPGAYHLLVLAGAEATSKGIPAEAGEASFEVTLTAEADPDDGGGVLIALPMGVYPGLALLLAALFTASAKRHAWR